MKSRLIYIIIILTILSCGEDKSNISAENKLRVRNEENITYFGAGVIKDVSYNSGAEEYEIIIEEDFEYRPFGETGWIPLEGIHNVKVRCGCWGILSGSCTVIESPEGEYSCVNNCSNYQSCIMKVKILNAADAVVDEFEQGGEFRLQ